MFKYLTGILNAAGNAKAEETKLAARKYAAALRLDRVEEDEYQEFLRTSSLGAQVREYIQSTQRMAESSPGLANAPPPSSSTGRGGGGGGAAGDAVAPLLGLSVGSPSSTSPSTASTTVRLLTKSGDTALEEILFNDLRQHPLSTSTVDCLEKLLSRPRHFVRAPLASASSSQTETIARGDVRTETEAGRVTPPASSTPLTAAASINPGHTSGAGRGMRNRDALPWRLVLLLLHRWHASLTDPAFLETDAAVFAYFETLFSCWCVLLDRRAVPRTRLLNTPLFHGCLKATVALLSGAVTAQYCTRRPTTDTTPTSTTSMRHSASGFADGDDTPTVPAPADAFSTLLLCLGLLCLVFGSPIAPFVDPARADNGAQLAAHLARTATSGKPGEVDLDAVVVDINVVRELLALLLPFSKGRYAFRGLAPSRQGEQLPTFGMTCLCLILNHTPPCLLERMEADLTRSVVGAHSILLARFSAGSGDAVFLIEPISAASRLLACLLRRFPVSLCDAMESAFFFDNATNALLHTSPSCTADSDMAIPSAVTTQREVAGSLLASITSGDAATAVALLADPIHVRLPCDPDVNVMLEAVLDLLHAAHEVRHETMAFLPQQTGDATAAQLLERLQNITEILFKVFGTGTDAGAAAASTTTVTGEHPHHDGMTAAASNASTSTSASPLLCCLLVRYARDILDDFPGYFHILIDLGLYTIVAREPPFAEDPVLVVATAAVLLQRLTDPDLTAITTGVVDGVTPLPDADVSLLLKLISTSMTALRGYSVAVPPAGVRLATANRLHVSLLVLEAAVMPPAPLSTVVQTLLIGADGFARLCELTVVVNERRKAQAAGMPSLEKIESCTRALILILATSPTAQAVLLRDADVSPVFICFSMPRWRETAATAVRALLQYRDDALSHNEYERLLLPLAQLCWDEIRHCEELEPVNNAVENHRGGDDDDDASDAVRKDAVLLALLRCFQEALAGVAVTATTAMSHDALPAVRALQEVVYQGASGECFLRLVHRISLPWSVSPEEGLEQVVRTLTVIMRGNPTMRGRLFDTISPGELTKVLRSEWLAARPGDWCGLTLLVLEMAFEAILLLPNEPSDATLTTATTAAFENEDSAPPIDSTFTLPPATLPVLTPSQLTIRNPALVAAVLQVVLSEATPVQSTPALPPAGPTATTTTSDEATKLARYHGLSVLLKVLVACTAAHQINLYILASVGCFDTVADVLRLIVTAPQRRLDHPTNPTVTALASMMADLLKSIAAHHVHVRDVKHLLLRNLVDVPTVAQRRLMLPVMTDVLCESVTNVLSSLRRPAHYLSLTRESGASGVRAVLPALHEDGYSVSMWVRLEQPVSRSTSTLQCLFSVQDAQRKVVFALAVEPQTRLLQCLMLDARGQEVVIPLEGPRVSLHTWVHIALLRRRPFAPSTAGNTGNERKDPSMPSTLFGNPNTLKEIQLYVNGEEASSVGRAGYSSISRGAFVLGYAPPNTPITTDSGDSQAVSAAAPTTATTPMQSFVGQAASVYFFGRVLWDSEVRQLYALQGSGNVETPSLTPALTAAATSMGQATVDGPAPVPGWPNTTGASPFVAVGAMGTETHLAGDALVCMDPRLRENGQLYNLSALANGRTKDARLQMFPGTIPCSTTTIVDSLSVLGAIYTTCMPLLTLTVNLQLPFAASGVQPLRTDDDAATTVVGTNHTHSLHQLLQLLQELLKVDVILPDFESSGVFVLTAQVLQELAPVLDAQVVTRLMDLCLVAHSISSQLFESAYTSFFLSPDLLHACTRETLVLWINAHRVAASSCGDDVRSSMRSLGAQLFCVSELIHFLDDDTNAAAAAATTATIGTEVDQSKPSGEAPIAVARIRDELFHLLDALTVEPITVADAVAIMHLVNTASTSACSRDTVLRDVLAHTRVLIATRPAILAQYLGRADYAVTLIRLLQQPSRSLAVRREALLQLLLLTSRSKRTQELMNPNYILSPDVVHVAKDVSMAWLKPIARAWAPSSMGTYMALRCGVVGDVARHSIPTRHEPFQSASVTIVFPPAIEPMLGLVKFADSSALKACALADLACVLQSDNQGWRRLIAIHGWYIQVINVYLSEYRNPDDLPSQAASPLQRGLVHSGSSGVGGGRRGSTTSVGAGGVAKTNSWGTNLSQAGDDEDDYDDDDEEETEETRLARQQTILSCAAAILAGTLFQALLQENYAAEELLYVVSYLETNDADVLLSRTLYGIAERYIARLTPGTTTTATTMLPTVAAATGAAGTASPPPPFAQGSSQPPMRLEGNGLANLVCFVQTVEAVLFCHPNRTPASTPSLAAATTTTTTTSEDTTGLGNLLVLTPKAAADSVKTGPGSVALHPPRVVSLTSLPHQEQIALLKRPDGRWPHLPLALKVAELISTNSLLLHYGTSTTIGGVVSSELLLPFVGSVGGGGSTGHGNNSSNSANSTAGGGTGASYEGGGGTGSGGGGQAVRRLAKGGFLRIFGRLVCAVCQLTLRDGNTLDALFVVLHRYVGLVEGDQGGAFSLLRRIVSFDEEARDHSNVATSMQLVYALNDLVQRRLRGDVQDAAPRYPFPNAEVVCEMQGLFALFKKSFQQTGLFSKAAPEESRAERYAKVPTLQWLSTQFGKVTSRTQADAIVEAFAEISSRTDYNAFMDRCQSAVERAQQTAKAVAVDAAREREGFRMGLDAVLREIYRARTTVSKSVTDYVAQHPSRAAAIMTDADVAELASSLGGDVGTASVSSGFFSLGHASSVLRTLRASTWARFLLHLRGTLWNLDPAGQRSLKYVRLLRNEQLPLLRRKLVFDRNGTDHHNVTLPAHRPAKPLMIGESQLKESQLRLRGGEAVLLQDAKLSAEAEEEEEDAEAAEVANRTHMESSGAVLQRPSTHAGLRLRAFQQATGVDGGLDADAPTGLGGRADETNEVGQADGNSSNGDDDEDNVEGLLHLETPGTPDAPQPLHSPRPSVVSSGGLLSPRANQSYRSVADRAEDTVAASAVSASAPVVLSLPCEVPHLMICWSATFTVRGSTIVVLIDEKNTSHNQSVPADAKPFVVRPHNVSFDALSIEQLAPGRRFRMRRTAMEFWLTDRRSVFVNFHDVDTMRTALSTIFLVASSASVRRGARGVLTGFYVYSENPKTEPLRLQLMNEWQNRRITNFEYLLWLNQLAGRSLNDLSQYPVFPWVIADYSSATLDLSNVATFRDLRLPIGACGTEERRRLVRSRYEEMKEMGDVPSHYFTHYSSPAVTLYYLVRLEPFTTLQILLQGGHLDHADRMFHSMQSCFRSVTTSSQDVRELIPELFYLPELCLNQNHVAYGVKQDGVAMDSLELPPWAHGDPYEFVYHMRRALESDYVSTYLHNWIDLIFGFKQRGKDAIECLNMFNWHSYEDLDRNRGDSVDQELLIDSLDNVGQTPIQLFRHPHKARPARELMDPADAHVTVRPKLLSMRWGCPSVALACILTNGRVVVVSTTGAVASFRYVAAPVYRATKTFHELPPTPLFTSPLSGNAHAAAAVTAAKAVGETLLNIVSGPEQYSFDMAEEHERRIPPLPLGVVPDWDSNANRAVTSASLINNGPHHQCGTSGGDSGDVGGACAPQNVVVLSYDSEAFVAIGGLFDNSVVIRPLSGTRRDVRLVAHSGRVTHLAASRDSRYMVTGAEDTTFILWRCFVASRRSPQLEVEMSFAVHGHEQNPSAAEVSSTTDILATASMDGVLMLHSLSTGNLDRTLRHPLGHSINRILILSNCYVPNLIFASNVDHVIHQFSLNGAPLRTLAVPGRITSWSMTPNQHLLIGCAASHRPIPVPPNRTGADDTATATAEDPTLSKLQKGGNLVLYVHSFFLDIRKVLPLSAVSSGFVTSLACHPTDAQVAVAATSEGQLALLRVATPQHLSL